MKGKELIEWIEKEDLAEAEVYVNTHKAAYAPVEWVWESEKDGGAIVLEVKKDACGD